MSFSISSGPAAVKPKCLPMSSNSTGKCGLLNLSALQKSPYHSGHFIENVLPLTLNLSRTGMEQSIRVHLFCLSLPLRGHLAHDGFGIV